MPSTFQRSKFDPQLITVGADPEVFFYNQKTCTGQSVEGLLGGTKTHPAAIPGLPDGFFIQEDGAAAEYNVPPATSMSSFVNSIHRGLGFVKHQAKRYGLQVKIQSEMVFPIPQLNTPTCQQLGCDPDINIWTLKQNPKPIPPDDFRTAAGHIHIGWPVPSLREARLIGMMAEAYITLPSVLITQPSRRRSLYGASGAVRFKDYGIEVRSPDNFWLRSRIHTKEVYQAVERIFLDIREMPNFADQMWWLLMNNAEEIQQAINSHDSEMAEYLCEKFDSPRFSPFDKAA